MHECMWSGCSKRVAADLAMCGEHWAILPPHIRAGIWRSYIPGQTAATALPDYHRAIARAHAWIVERFGSNGGHEPRYSPALWERLVESVRERDAARAARRAEAGPVRHLRLVP